MQNKNYRLIERAIDYLLKNHQSQPSLSDAANSVGLSEYYFQRLFVEWVGISPKRFSQFLSREYMKTLLDHGYTTLDASYQAGLSGGGRSHELFINTNAITPAEYKNFGKGLEIYYSFYDSPFGEYILAVTDRGICYLSFVKESKAEAEKELYDEWGLASLKQDISKTISFHKQLFSSSGNQRISLLMRGTQFQLQVWQALLKIPFGSVTNYDKVARAIGNQAASRASASAIAKNKIAYLIPCHRVIKKIGDSGEFRWGKTRKKVLLAYEAALTKK